MKEHERHCIAWLLRELGCTTPPRGPRPKLSADTERTVYEMVQAGWAYRVINERLGIPIGSIWRILARQQKLQPKRPRVVLKLRVPRGTQLNPTSEATA